MYDISFPHLGIVIEHLRRSVSVGGFEIAYYGIIIGTGMLIAMHMICRDAARLGDDPDAYTDVGMLAIVVGIICARAYYVLFSWEMYKDDLIQIFNIRGGGLAIYGGVIGGLGAIYIYSKVKKKSFLRMCDLIMPGVLVGQIMGRWGNFFNCEAFGAYTDSLLAMRIRLALVGQNMLDADVLSHVIVENGTEYIQVHPTFFYESVLNLCLLCYMRRHRRRQRFEGELFWIYIGGYGLIRAAVEGLRTDSLMIAGTGIRVSQLLAAVCVLTAAVMIYRGYARAAASGVKYSANYTENTQMRL